MSQQLVNALVEMTTGLPDDEIRQVLAILHDIDSLSQAGSSGRLVNAIPHEGYRRRAVELVKHWQEHPQLSGASLALALETAAATQAQGRNTSVELVWTGPSSPSIPLRRTDQVLIQLINAARRELWIVCFAVYRVNSVYGAIREALSRGIEVKLLLETTSQSEGRLSFDSLQKLNEELGKKVKLYTWPKEKRPKNEAGGCGVLHAKCAVADRKHLFISSANLTEFAMTLNMELGIALDNVGLGKRVVEHFENLALQKQIVEI